MAGIIDVKGMLVLGLLALIAAMCAIGQNKSIVNSVDKISIGVYSHAEVKHATATDARQCFDNQGADIVYNKSMERKGRLCLIPGVGMAIQILDKINNQWEEITAYVREGKFSQADLVTYAEDDMGKYGWISYIK